MPLTFVGTCSDTPTHMHACTNTSSQNMENVTTNFHTVGLVLAVVIFVSVVEIVMGVSMSHETPEHFIYCYSKCDIPSLFAACAQSLSRALVHFHGFGHGL